jgi:hypothetical protein
VPEGLKIEEAKREGELEGEAKGMKEVAALLPQVLSYLCI